jgi:rhamnosyltransferase
LRARRSTRCAVVRERTGHAAHGAATLENGVNTFAIVVSYNPNAEVLARLCRTLAASGAQVVVVDNTESGDVERGFDGETCTRIALGKNTGIAHAQYVGIAMALERGADVIVFFDQDSEPGDDFLPCLLAGMNPAEPGVAAPVCRDKATGEELPSLRLGPLSIRRNVVSNGRDSPYPVDLVISSGTAATSVTFALVGRMDEDFFIDFVDFEWCFRCRARQVPIRVVPDAVMCHSIGERTVDLGILRGSVHSATRSYYKIRNCFLLFRKPAIPFLFATFATLSAIVRYILLLPFAKHRLDYAKVLFAAIADGVVGVTGKNPSTATQRSGPK